MYWITVAQDRERYRAVVSAAMNFRVSKDRLVSQEGLCSMEVGS
jgi:hypothetical protein